MSSKSPTPIKWLIVAIVIAAIGLTIPTASASQHATAVDSSAHTTFSLSPEAGQNVCTVHSGTVVSEGHSSGPVPVPAETSTSDQGLTSANATRTTQIAVSVAPFQGELDGDTMIDARKYNHRTLVGTSNAPSSSGDEIRDRSTELVTPDGPNDRVVRHQSTTGARDTVAQNIEVANIDTPAFQDRTPITYGGSPFVLGLGIVLSVALGAVAVKGVDRPTVPSLISMQHQLSFPGSLPSLPGPELSRDERWPTTGSDDSSVTGSASAPNQDASRKGREHEPLSPGQIGTMDDASVPSPRDDMVPDDQVVERLLDVAGGRLKQGNIVEATGWSKSKVSRLLSSMDDQDRIQKVRIGRENLICLPGHEPSAARNPRDGESTAATDAGDGATSSESDPNHNWARSP